MDDLVGVEELKRLQALDGREKKQHSESRNTTAVSEHKFKAMLTPSASSEHKNRKVLLKITSRGSSWAKKIHSGFQEVKNHFTMKFY